MTPSDLQRLSEQLQDQGCDRVVTATPGRALALSHADCLLLLELGDDGSLHIHGDAVGNLGNAKLYTPSGAVSEESFEESFQTDDFDKAVGWLEEWLDDVS